MKSKASKPPVRRSPRAPAVDAAARPDNDAARGPAARAVEALRARIAARVRHLLDAMSAEHEQLRAAGLCGRPGVDCIHAMAFRAPEGAIVDAAVAGAVACARRFAPRHAAAVMDDEHFAWRVPLALGPYDSATPHPLSPSARAAENLDSSRPLPRVFEVDPRAGLVMDAWPHMSAEDHAREIAAKGLQTVRWWSGVWPDNVTTAEVFRALRAARDPEALAAMFGEVGSVYGYSADGSPVVAPEIPKDHPALVDVDHPAWPRGGLRHYDRGALFRWLARHHAPALERDRRAELMRVSPPPDPEGRPWIPMREAVRLAAAGDVHCAEAVGQAVGRLLRERWNPRGIAQVLSAVRRVEEGQRAARLFAVPASQVARVPFEMMAQGAAYTAPGRELARVPRAGFRVAWDGKPRGEQLSFGFALFDVPTAQVFREIMRELKAEGLRDYVILHRMASEQGRTGRFRWTWEAHRRATMHDRRVSAGNARDDDARAAVVENILRLTRAELHAEVEQGGRRGWRVIGDAPLVYVTGGVEHGGRIEGLTLQLNPALYQGAIADGERYFTQLPEAVLRLPSLPFCLAVMLGFRWRYARDYGGAVEFTAEELHAYMDAARWRGKHQAAAVATLHRALDAIAASMGEGCTWEALDGGRYRIAPPRAWVHAVVHEVPPELPPTTTHAPRTGAELAAWREARGLSQARAAEVLGVGVATIKRAEGSAGDPLPRSFRDVDWSGAPANDRAQLEPGPVEGGDAGGGRGRP